MKWTFQGETFDEKLRADSFGYTYIVTHKTKKVRYIGSKQFKFKTSKPPLKGRVNKRRGTKESDWVTYRTSSKAIQAMCDAEGEEAFTWEILKLCPSPWWLHYEETKAIIDHGALTSHDYLNDYLRLHLPGNKPKII